MLGLVGVLTGGAGLVADRLLGPRSVALRDGAELPDWVDPAAVPAGESVAALDGDELYLVLLGSSSCPPVPVQVGTWTRPSSCRCRPTSNPGWCTADLAPTTYVLQVPAPLQSTGPLAVVLRGDWGRAGAGAPAARRLSRST